MTLVSVLLPVRNGLPYLRESLDSVLAQSMPDFEVLVIDDGSTDGSADAARATRDPRVRVLSTGGVGIAAALNAGLHAARGVFIARQDADDLSAINRFQAQVEYFDRRPEIAVLSSAVRFIDHHGRGISTPWTRAVRAEWECANTPEQIAALMPQTCCIVHGTVMARRDAVMACGGYNASLTVAQDYDLWLRMLPACRFTRLPDLLYTFRLHDDQVSATRNREQARQAIASKLQYLQASAGLRRHVRTHIRGEGAGVALYRDAIEQAGWIECSAHDADVTVFTDFTTIERDMTALRQANSREQTRIGNFLVAGQALA